MTVPGTPAAGVPAAVPGGAAALPADPCDVVGAATSAAVTLGWGEPTAVEEFDAPLGDAWDVYTGTGYAGEGSRTAEALTLADGVLRITGDAAGATGGIAWKSGQLYGRWEGRMRAPAGDESYNPLLLLWPDANNFPVGGEIDFVDMQDPTRQTTNAFLHHGVDNQQLMGETEIDGTEWHNWAVEWTPTHIATFVDGVEWWRTEDAAIIPRGPMHLCVQLDYFPTGETVEETQMEVAWVRQYAVDVVAPSEDPADPAVPTIQDGSDDSPSDDDASSDDVSSDDADSGSDDATSDDGDSGSDDSDASSDDGDSNSGDGDSSSDDGDSDDGGSEGLVDVGPAATGGAMTEGAPDDTSRRGLVGQAVPAS